MIRLLLALPLLVSFAQEPTIEDLIKRLDDSDLEAREKAVKDLIKIGAKALEPLRKAAASESAEVRARAEQAIRFIEIGIKSREVCPPYPAFTLKHSGTVGEVLDELAKLSGARIEASAEQRAGKASADATSLFQALDQVCAGRDDLTYSFGDDGKVKFLSERHSPAPAGYFEAFKVFLTEIHALRRSD
jgi:hypothetical protein